MLLREFAVSTGVVCLMTVHRQILAETQLGLKQLGELGYDDVLAVVGATEVEGRAIPLMKVDVSLPPQTSEDRLSQVWLPRPTQMILLRPDRKLPLLMMALSHVDVPLHDIRVV